MDTSDAVRAFSALGQPTRLDVLRLLIRAGAPGVPAGEIAKRLGVRQNTLSANLAVLRDAGLIGSERRGRSIRYFANARGLRALLGFLMEDCCGGLPERCRPLIEEVTHDH